MAAVEKRAKKDVQEFYDHLETVQLLPEKTNYDLKRNLGDREHILQKQTKKALLELRAEIRGNEESESGTDSSSSSGSGSESGSEDESDQ